MHRISSLLPFLFSLLFVAGSACAQNPPSTAPSTPSANQQTLPELSQHDETTTFKVNVKLVMVRVVVRDSQGHAIGNLQKEDFQLFDKGKPQVISQFEAVHPGESAPKPNPVPPDADDPAMHRLGAMPDRYVAYVFDDEHLVLANLQAVREAAQRHFLTLQPTDRAAVFTTSGKVILDFTDDRSKLNDATTRIVPAITPDPNACPDISYYEADLIVNQNNKEAIEVATQDYLECSMLNAPQTTHTMAQSGTATKLAPALIPSAAQGVLSKGDMESRQSLSALKDIVRRFSSVPGQRSVVLVSPGFLTPRMEPEFADVVDRAIRSQVVLNTIDARGLYASLPGGDIQKRNTLIDPSPSQNQIGSDPNVLKAQYQNYADRAQADTLSSLADQTGGTFVHNSNDFDAAFRRAGPPEYSYLLAFYPQDGKPDGSFHTLKVALKAQKNVTIQARRGYFAADKKTDPAEQAKAEMMDALFSQDELHELPVELHTQFFKATEDQARLTVLAHVDLKHLQFHKANGRNDNVLTCDSALFNQNGSYVQGTQKVVTLHLKDETLETKLNSGIVLKSSFENVKPGNYMVRLVVRDQEGQLMSAQSGVVEIP